MTDQEVEDDLHSFQRLELLLGANRDPEITMVAVPKALLLDAINDWDKATAMADALVDVLQEVVDEVRKRL